MYIIHNKQFKLKTWIKSSVFKLKVSLFSKSSHDSAPDTGMTNNPGNHANRTDNQNNPDNNSNRTNQVNNNVNLAESDSSSTTEVKVTEEELTETRAELLAKARAELQV